MTEKRPSLLTLVFFKKVQIGENRGRKRRFSGQSGSSLRENRAFIEGKHRFYPAKTCTLSWENTYFRQGKHLL